MAAAEGTVPFYRAPWNDAENSIVRAAGLEHECDVAAVPLAKLLSEEELSTTRLIKIDVEGAEFNVVAGLLPAVDRLHRDAELVAEVHPDVLAEGKSVSGLIELLEPVGFVPYWLPVDFSPLAHLDPPPSIRPARLDEPTDKLIHLVLSRRRAAEL